LLEKVINISISSVNDQSLNRNMAAHWSLFRRQEAALQEAALQEAAMLEEPTFKEAKF
jgi:hypothetical protein